MEDLVQFMSLIKASEKSNTLTFSQTRIKVVPGWGTCRHRNQINVSIIIRGKQKLNIGTIGTIGDFSNKDREWTKWRNPGKIKWNNSTSNHEANRLRINKQKSRE